MLIKKIINPLVLFITQKNSLDKSTLQNLNYTYEYPYLIYCVEV